MQLPPLNTMKACVDRICLVQFSFVLWQDLGSGSVLATTMNMNSLLKVITSTKGITTPPSFTKGKKLWGRARQAEWKNR